MNPPKQFFLGRNEIAKTESLPLRHKPSLRTGSFERNLGNRKIGGRGSRLENFSLPSLFFLFSLTFGQMSRLAGYHKHDCPLKCVLIFVISLCSYQSNTAKEVLETIMAIQPKDVGGGTGETRESIVTRLAEDMLEKLPPDYVPHEVR